MQSTLSRPESNTLPKILSGISKTMLRKIMAGCGIQEKQFEHCKCEVIKICMYNNVRTIFILPNDINPTSIISKQHKSAIEQC